ncbi:MAG: hypothetical protein AB3N20_02030 [Rhizobiaceae bacterium]
MSDHRDHTQNEAFRGYDYYMERARIERSKAARRFFRRLVGAVDKADTKSWG